MARPILAPIPGEIARPFVSAYAEAWNIPVSWDGFERVVWYGSWDQVLRAAAGFMRVPGGLYVYGLYGDNSGTRSEARAISYLLQMLAVIPERLYGIVHASNAGMCMVLSNRTNRYQWKKTGEIWSNR